MLCRKQDAAPRVNRETPHASGDAARKPELARRIQKENRAFTGAVALAARPQANPLRDGQILARRGSADRVLNVEGNGNRFDRLARGRRMTCNRNDSAGKDRACSTSDQGEADRSGWSYGQVVAEFVWRRRLTDFRQPMDCEFRRRIDAPRLALQ